MRNDTTKGKGIETFLNLSLGRETDARNSS